MSQTVDLGIVVGDTGPVGPTGPQGPTGPKGDTGPKGENATVTDTATSEYNGLMSSNDKSFLDSLPQKFIGTENEAVVIPEGSDLDSYTTPGIYRFDRPDNLYHNNTTDAEPNNLLNSPIYLSPFYLYVYKFEHEDKYTTIQELYPDNKHQICTRLVESTYFSPVDTTWKTKASTGSAAVFQGTLTVGGKFNSKTIRCFKTFIAQLDAFGSVASSTQYYMYGTVNGNTIVFTGNAYSYDGQCVIATTAVFSMVDVEDGTDVTFSDYLAVRIDNGNKSTDHTVRMIFGVN